jgi:hypothetical protein
MGRREQEKYLNTSRHALRFLFEQGVDMYVISYNPEELSLVIVLYCGPTRANQVH